MSTNETRWADYMAEPATVAYMEGRKATAADVNPYLDRALFDPDQRAEAWYRGRKDARDARYKRRRPGHAWGRA